MINLSSIALSCHECVATAFKSWCVITFAVISVVFLGTEPCLAQTESVLFSFNWSDGLCRTVA